MAIKWLTLALFFAFVVIKPVHDNVVDDDPKHHKPGNGTLHWSRFTQRSGNLSSSFKKEDPPALDDGASYLWMYLVFSYFFTWTILYLIIVESKRIIAVRQNYLGSQSTITDRTIRLSGIPKDLQSETKIKDFIEELEIGKVDSVLLCRDWTDLDEAMEKRAAILRKLERALVENEQRLREERSLEALPTPNAAAASDMEDSRLLEESHLDDDRHARPLARIWMGRLNLTSKHVDAIDYYEEKLRLLDERISHLRTQDFPTQPLAFVTMDSVATCVSVLIDDWNANCLSKWLYKQFWTLHRCN
jgi:calcium permeable stress-gated cation channel